jgi:hypothetical protein
MIRCKDYHIIRVRYYADQKLLDKHHKETPNGPYPKQHHDRAKSYYAFKMALIKHVTGFDQQALFDMYQFGTVDCGLEDMEEMSGIRYSSGEGWDTFMIPKERTDLIEWFHQNLTENPFRVMKVIRMGYQKYREFPSRFKRDFAIENKIDLSKYKTGQ